MLTTTWRNLLRVAAAVAVAVAITFGAAGHGAIPGAAAVGAGSGGGTILFLRHENWYTIAPNGTHLHKILSDTTRCPGFGCAVLSPRGDRIVVSANAPDHMRLATAVLNVGGSGYRVFPLPDRTLNLGPGAWSPNGTRIAVEGWDDAKKGRNGIYVINSSNGKGLIRLTTSPGGHHDVPLAYSPDGSRLLFLRDVAQQGLLPQPGDLFETTANGSGSVKLNPPGTSVVHPFHFGNPGSWSPNGQRIAYTAFPGGLLNSIANSNGRSAVFVADANGSHRRRITSWGEGSASAHWSPDGTWILFDRPQPGTAGVGPHFLFLVHPNGTGLKAITSISLGDVCCAVWSPDGKKLLFLSGPSTGSNLVIMNRDGFGPRRLTPGGPGYPFPTGYAWGP
jgi:Tol biopolymer transport system component